MSLRPVGELDQRQVRALCERHLDLGGHHRLQASPCAIPASGPCARCAVAPRRHRPTTPSHSRPRGIRLSSAPSPRRARPPPRGPRPALRPWPPPTVASNASRYASQRADSALGSRSTAARAPQLLVELHEATSATVATMEIQNQVGHRLRGNLSQRHNVLDAVASQGITSLVRVADNTAQPFAAVASTDRSGQHLPPTQTHPNIAHGLAHPPILQAHFRMGLD